MCSLLSTIKFRRSDLVSSSEQLSEISLNPPSPVYFKRMHFYFIIILLFLVLFSLYFFIFYLFYLILSYIFYFILP